MDRTVLIIDDEKNIVDILTYNLQHEGYKTIEAFDGRDGLRSALKNDPDLILLDVMLPHMDGFEVLGELRSRGVTIPVIMLTAREEETDKVFGLENGADDYITKPFSVRELLARVKANIRRTGMVPAPAEGGAALTAGSLAVDTDKLSVTKNGKALELSQREYELLCFMMEAPGKVFTREELMTDVWNYDYYGDLRAVDVAIRRLREKLEDNPAEPEFIITKRGMGYYFGVR